MTRSTRVLLAALALLLAAPASAPAAVLVTGTLTDATGTPSAGAGARVRVGVSQARADDADAFARYHHGRAGRHFSVTSLDNSLLSTLATPRGGWLDFTVVGDTGTATGTWGYTGFVDAPAGVARVSTADDIIQARASDARIAVARTRRAEVTVRALNRTMFARAAQYGRATGIATSVRSGRRASSRSSASSTTPTTTAPRRRSSTGVARRPRPRSAPPANWKTEAGASAPST